MTGAQLSFETGLQVLRGERSTGKNEWEKVVQLGGRYCSNLRKRREWPGPGRKQQGVGPWEVPWEALDDVGGEGLVGGKTDTQFSVGN